MKYYLIFTIFALLSLSQCDSVTGPETIPGETDSNTPGQSLEKPDLQHPENNVSNMDRSPVLSWDKVIGATSYKIQLSSSSTFSDTLLDQTTDTTEYQVNGLSHQTTYYWKVSAVNKNSLQGPWSDSWSFTTASKSENEEPVSTTLKSPADGAVDQPLKTSLEWFEVLNAKGYQVQIASSPDFSDLKSDTVTKSTAYQTNGASYNQTYYWRVQPRHDSTETKWSDIRKFTTRAEPAQEPVRTTLTAPSDGSNGQTTAPTLQWQEAAEANNYRVQVNTEDSFTNPIIDQTEQATSVSLSGLDSETTYYWRVLPQTATDNGEWTDVWNFKTEKASDDDGNEGGTAPSDMWVSAYLASYNHYAPPGGNWGNMPTEEIDWDAFTHLFYFALHAKADGSLSDIASFQNMSPDRINTIVTAAHAHQKPVIITIGGWGNYDGFSKAISPVIRSVFVANLVALIETWGFDGIDLDMEPIRSGDVDNYKAFVKELRTALDNLTTPIGDKPLLTAATIDQPHMFSDLQEYFDQINLMTYDYSGAWEGWVSWHNSALYDGELKFPNSSKSLPSVHGTIEEFIAAGVQKSKLGIGIDFYGYVWSGGSGTSSGGVTDPNQSWTTAPTVTDNVPYHEIMNKYHKATNHQWDDQAKAAYLRIDEANNSDDKFISFDDSKTIEEKINYIRQQQQGGTIIWELSGGYQKDQPAGSRDKLLQAVKNNVW